MASIHPKKLAAAVAAVLQYAAEAEAAVAAPGAVAVAAAQVAGPAGLPPLWGWAGRQEAMHDRLAWQRRVLKSW